MKIKTTKKQKITSIDLCISLENEEEINIMKYILLNARDKNKDMSSMWYILSENLINQLEKESQMINFLEEQLK